MANSTNNGETLRGMILTFLDHAAPNEFTAGELGTQLGVWHIHIANAIKPLVRRGRVVARTNDKGRVAYRAGKVRDLPGEQNNEVTADVVAALRAEIRAEHASLEARIAALEKRGGE